MEQNQPGSLFGMEADSLAQSRLSSISNWGKFIAITVLIMVALCAIFFFVSRDAIISAMSTVVDLDNKAAGVLIAIVVVSLGLFLIWFIFLLRAAIFIRQGLAARDSDKLADGFKALRIFFVLSMVFSLFSILGTLSNFIKS